jgi:hypothetical protein
LREAHRGVLAHLKAGVVELKLRVAAANARQRRSANEMRSGGQSNAGTRVGSRYPNDLNYWVAYGRRQWGVRQQRSVLNTAGVHALLRVYRCAIYIDLAAQILLALLRERQMKVGKRGGLARRAHNQPSAVGSHEVE